MPIAHQCTICFRSAPDVTIVDCPATDAHGPGLSGRCDECLRKTWLENRKPYNLNGEKAFATEQQRYYNNAEAACQFCLYQSNTLRRLPGTCADYHLPGCARRVDDPDHMGPCTTTCTKTRFEGRPCRFHNHHLRVCEPMTADDHRHVAPEYVCGKRRR